MLKISFLLSYIYNKNCITFKKLYYVTFKKIYIYITFNEEFVKCCYKTIKILKYIILYASLYLSCKTMTSCFKYLNSNALII